MSEELAIKSALNRCVGDVKDFLLHVWGKRPSYYGGSDPSAYDDLASLDVLDQWLVNGLLRVPFIRLVKDGETLAEGQFTNAVRQRRQVLEGLVSPSAVYKHFAEGATVIFEGSHRYWSPLRNFCRALEIETGHPFQVNTYLTPPGSQGFLRHSDDHDVFVLQIHGAKRWNVWEPSLSSLVLDEELQRGDCLYIPEGFPHAAFTTSEAAAHLTVGALTHTRRNVANSIWSVIEDSPRFLERLPVGLHNDNDELRRLVSEVVSDLVALLSEGPVDRFVRSVERRVATTRQRPPPGGLKHFIDAQNLSMDALLRVREDNMCRLYDEPDGLHLLLADRELLLPRFLRPALEHLATGTASIESLAGILPDLDSRLVLVRRLVLEGYLLIDGTSTPKSGERGSFA